jgi:hypothetical protein
MNIYIINIYIYIYIYILVRFDSMVRRLREDGMYTEREFTVLKRSSVCDGVVEEIFKGCWLLSDNGYHTW